MINIWFVFSMLLGITFARNHESMNAIHRSNLNIVPAFIMGLIESSVYTGMLYFLQYFLQWINK
jgi:hypothetical protein